MNNNLVILDEETNNVSDPAEDLLLAHAISAGKPFLEKPLSLTAVFSDNTDHPIGYLEGTSMQGRFYLSRLAIEQSVRGENVGSSLMKRLEEIVIARGDVEIVLDTWNFQAEKFYSNLGYNVIGRLPDLPQGAGKVWMNKQL